jgi:hypothetical protein
MVQIASGPAAKDEAGVVLLPGERSDPTETRAMRQVIAARFHLSDPVAGVVLALLRGESVA